MKHIAVLGSTGSIGRNTLEVLKDFSGKFRVTALSANSNVDILYQQAKVFNPALVCITDKDAAIKLKSKHNLNGIKLFTGEDGLQEMVCDRRIDKVVLAISGKGALMPLLKAIENKKDIALANKEALVMAGHLIMEKASRSKIMIIPIDSEQSAIWQCLDGQDKKKLKNIYLTASGGPLRRLKKEYFRHISIGKVLRHPRWKMGRKISVDSATLMNKGLELLEATHLFGVKPDKIKILVHPEAIIHSMVEFIDGVILAQLSVTDMRIPIQYALTYPERLANRLAPVDFCALKKLSFQKPDFQKFPCLRLSYEVAKEEGTMPAVLNAANEVTVEEFLKRKLSFILIPKVIEKALSRHHNKLTPGLHDILQADNWAREEAHRIIRDLN